MNKHLITCILLVPLVCSCGKQATTSVDTREPLLLNDSLQEIITLDTVRDTPLTNELLLNGRVQFQSGASSPCVSDVWWKCHLHSCGSWRLRRERRCPSGRSGAARSLISTSSERRPSINWLSLTVTWRLPKIWPGAVWLPTGTSCKPSKSKPMPRPRPNVSKKCIPFIT